MVTEEKENIMYTPCPHCGVEIKVIGCSTCVHIHDNMEDYMNSECKTCDMLHTHYKRQE